uniref:Peptidase A1 domain-containing protein n=1 Tax=Fagus sylvatica TaxID=28930 RepID=A0A2N9FL19_FAGSY
MANRVYLFSLSILVLVASAACVLVLPIHRGRNVARVNNNRSFPIASFWMNGSSNPSILGAGPGTIEDLDLASLRLDSAHGYLINEASNIVEVLEDGYHYANVKLGTSPTEFKVSIDTGSDLLWIPCTSMVQDLPRFSTHESEFPSDRPFVGILGLSPSKVSILSQLASKEMTPRVVSMCLGDYTQPVGFLVFGEAVDPNMVFTPLIPHSKCSHQV